MKKLSIRCWTSLYPWHHPCCCRCRFFLLLLRLFAPRRRSLLGLVLLNPPSFLPRFASYLQHRALCFLPLPPPPPPPLPPPLPPHSCNSGSVHVCSRGWLLWLHQQSSVLFPSNKAHLDSLSDYSRPQKNSKQCIRKEGGHTVCRHRSHSQPACCTPLKLRLFLSRASYRNCILSTMSASVGTERLTHQHHGRPSSSSRLEEDRTRLCIVSRFAATATQTVHIHSIRHARGRPLQLAEKQLGLFPHWCISFT